MAQVSYGTITVSDITDITDVYLEYCLALSDANADAVSKRGTASGIAWQTGEVSWSTTYPTWVSGYQIWIRQATEKEGLATEYGTPYLDTAVNQINNFVTEFDSRTKYFWRNQNPQPNYPVGTYAISGNDKPFNHADSSTYGYNTYYANGIKFRYNAFNLAELDGNGLKLYYGAEENGIPIQGDLAMELNQTALNFYNPETGGVDASLGSSGLYIDKGAINLNDSSLYTLDKRTWDTDSVGIYIGSDTDETGFFTVMAGGRIQYVPTEDTEPYDTTEYFEIVNVLTDDLIIDGGKTYYKEYNGDTIPVEQNEYYVLTNDTTIIEDKKYYKLITGATVEYTIVTDQDKQLYSNPHNAGWFELASPKTEGWYENTYQKVVPNPTDNPYDNGWFESAGPMWYMKSDGSASFSSLTIDRNGILEVPAASISGKLDANQIEVNNLSAISTTIGSILGQENSVNTFKVGVEKIYIPTIDDRLVPGKNYYRLVAGEQEFYERVEEETLESRKVETLDEEWDDEKNYYFNVPETETYIIQTEKFAYTESQDEKQILTKDYYISSTNNFELGNFYDIHNAIPCSNENITTSLNEVADNVENYGNDSLIGNLTEGGEIVINYNSFSETWQNYYNNEDGALPNIILNSIPLVTDSTQKQNLLSACIACVNYMGSDLVKGSIGSVQLENILYKLAYSYGFIPTFDTEILVDKEYFQKNGNVYEKINNPTGNPKDLGYYEKRFILIIYKSWGTDSLPLINTPLLLSKGGRFFLSTNDSPLNEYVLTLDIEIIPGKEYYTYDSENEQYIPVSNEEGEEGESSEISPYGEGWYEKVIIDKDIYYKYNQISGTFELITDIEEGDIPTENHWYEIYSPANNSINNNHITFYEATERRPKDERLFEDSVSPALLQLFEKIDNSEISFKSEKIIYKLTLDTRVVEDKVYYKFSHSYAPTQDTTAARNKDYFTSRIATATGEIDESQFLITFEGSQSPVENLAYERINSYQEVTDEELNNTLNPYQAYWYEIENSYTSELILNDSELNILANDITVLGVKPVEEQDFNIYSGDVLGTLKIGNLEVIPYNDGLAIRAGR